MSKPLSPAYLRTQAARCQRLSRMCMDLGTARDLRLMSDEYLAEAADIEQAERRNGRAQVADGNSMDGHSMREFAPRMQVGRSDY